MYVYDMDGMNHVFRMVVRYLLPYVARIYVDVLLRAESRFMDPVKVKLQYKYENLLGDEYVRDERPACILLLEGRGRSPSPIQAPSTQIASHGVPALSFLQSQL